MEARLNTIVYYRKHCRLGDHGLPASAPVRYGMVMNTNRIADIHKQFCKTGVRFNIVEMREGYLKPPALNCYCLLHNLSFALKRTVTMCDDNATILLCSDN